MPKRTPDNKQLSLRLSVALPEVMWAAGFYEGEGSLWDRSVKLSQVNIWPLLKVQKLFGGSMRLETKRSSINHKPIWVLYISGARGRDFVEAIYPHLSPHRQAQIDDKFITWEKHHMRRAIFGPQQSKQARALVERLERDPVTGRLRRAR
jgi:hypothetical protein